MSCRDFRNNFVSPCHVGTVFMCHLNLVSLFYSTIFLKGWKRRLHTELQSHCTITHISEKPHRPLLVKHFQRFYLGKYICLTFVLMINIVCEILMVLNIPDQSCCLSCKHSLILRDTVPKGCKMQ